MRNRLGYWLWAILFLALTACSTAQAFVSPLNNTTQDYFTYTVQPGDTASQISIRYHITIEQLIALNADKYPSLARNPASLQPGWQLRIPKSGILTPSAEPQVDLKEASREIIDLINQARAQKGLQLLRSDIALNHIADQRSTDMITRDYFSHYDPQTGQEPLLRYLQATNFTYRFAGENIAEIKNDAGWVPPWLTVAARYSAVDLANEFVKGWLNSPEHRTNIFSSNYKRTGVALAVDAEGKRIVATQVFAD